MTTEKRRLEILAAMKDLISSPMKKIGREIRRGFDTGTKAVKGFRVALGGTQTLLATVLAGAAARKGVQIFDELSEGLAKVNDQSAATNTSAESLLLLRNAAAENRIEFDQLTAAVRTFEKNIGDAQQGAKTQRESLRRLGLTTEQFVGTNKDAVEQMALVADALQTVEDASIRSNLALKLFGEDTGASLLPLLAKGGDALRQFAADQTRIGNTFSNEQIQQAAQYRLELQRLKNTMALLGEQVVVELAPALIKLFEDLRGILERNAPYIKEVLKDLVTVTGIAFGGIIKLGGLLRKSFLGIQEAANLATFALAKLTGDDELARGSERRIAELDKQVKETERATNELAEAFFNIDKQIDALDGRKLPEFPGNNEENRKQAQEVMGDWGRFWEGFRENATRAKERWTDFYQAGLDGANQLIDGGLRRLGDAFGDTITGVRKGKEVWRSFAQSVLQDLGRIIGRLIVLKTVQAVTNSFGGSASASTLETGASAQPSVLQQLQQQSASGSSSSLPASSSLNGGSIGRPVAPVSLAGSGGGNTTIVNFNIQAWDGRDATRAIFRQRGQIRAMFQSDMQRKKAVRDNVRSTAN